MRALTSVGRRAIGMATVRGWTASGAGAGSGDSGGRRRLVAGRRATAGGTAGPGTGSGSGAGGSSGAVVGGAASPLVGFEASLATTQSTAPDKRTTSRMESTTGVTAGGSVPPDPPVPDERLGLRAVVATLAMLGAAVFLWAAFTFEIPYYAFSPGSAVDTAPLVTVDEDHAHPPDGSILLTTVSLAKVTIYEALRGWLDPATDVVGERVIIGDRDIDEDELREENLRAMDESKQKAIGVAFEALGIDAITGAGAEIVAVEPGTPADGVVEVGDVVVGVDGESVALDADVISVIGARAPGDTATLQLVGADGTEREETVTFIARPGDEDRAYLGVALTTKDLAFDFPFAVDVQSERIGGPSAGLAFTLEVIDVLTPGELTGGRTVATTGTIELDGTVGEVGGVAQKTIAVRRSGADLFIVPSGELALARRFAGDELQVVAADTLEEALTALAEVGGNGLALPNLGAGSASS